MRRRLGLVAVAVASLIVVAFSVPLGVMVRDGSIIMAVEKSCRFKRC